MSNAESFTTHNHESPNEELMVNGIWLNPTKSTCRVFGREVTLSKNQTVVLQLLMKNPGVFYTRDQILDVLGDPDINERSVDTQIKRLKDNLFGKDNPLRDGFIETKNGVGYRVPDLRSRRDN